MTNADISSGITLPPLLFITFLGHNEDERADKYGSNDADIDLDKSGPGHLESRLTVIVAQKCDNLSRSISASLLPYLSALSSGPITHGSDISKRYL
jgi:hypothetical protein